jgi:hypothetical protein
LLISQVENLDKIINTQRLVKSNFPPKNKLCTRQRVLIMEGGNKEMEVNITKQQDDDSIRTYCDQIMEEKNEHGFKQ